MSQTLKPASVIAPGRILARELEARGWTQRDLAKIMGWSPLSVNEIVCGTGELSAETASKLAEVFGTSPEFWTNLDANYRVFVSRENDAG